MEVIYLQCLEPNLLSVQFSCSVMSNTVTPWTAVHHASLSITNSWSLLKLMSIELVLPSNHLILCHPLLLPPSIFPIIRVFSNESVLRIRWSKYWSFSFNISPSNEYSGLISFGWTDWISLQSKGLSRVFSNTTVQKHQRVGVTCKFLETISAVRLLIQGEAGENEFISWLGNWLVYVLTQSKSIDLSLNWSFLTWSDIFFKT